MEYKSAFARLVVEQGCNARRLPFPYTSSMQNNDDYNDNYCNGNCSANCNAYNLSYTDTQHMKHVFYRLICIKLMPKHAHLLDSWRSFFTVF